MAQRKRGKLSLIDQQYITEHVSLQSISDIAIHINRTEATVEKYCSKANISFRGMSEGTFADNEMREKLHGKSYWFLLKEQFDDIELQYFEDMWIQVMQQLKEDILFSEEQQLKQWITLDIMGNRVLSNRKITGSEIERANEMLMTELQKDAEEREPEIVMSLENQLSFLRNSLTSFTTEYAKILAQSEKVQKELKTARSDRVKQVIDSKTSWEGILIDMEDVETQKRIGEDAEISRMAMHRAFLNLSKYHTFEDGGVDTCILNSETVKLNNEREQASE